MRNLDFLVKLWFLVSGGEIDDYLSVVVGSMIVGRWWQHRDHGQDHRQGDAAQGVRRPQVALQDQARRQALRGRMQRRGAHAVRRTSGCSFSLGAVYLVKPHGERTRKGIIWRGKGTTA